MMLIEDMRKLNPSELIKTLKQCSGDEGESTCMGCIFQDIRFDVSSCEDGLMRQAADMLECMGNVVPKDFHERCLQMEIEKRMQLEEKHQWVSVKDRPPENEQEVFIYCNRGGFKFVCPAIYEDGTMLTQNSRWNWYDIEEYGTYNEENDDYFVPKGWWENRQFTPDDVYNCPVDCEVTHWRPLPKPPKEEEQ